MFNSKLFSSTNIQNELAKRTTLAEINSYLSAMVDKLTSAKLKSNKQSLKLWGNLYHNLTAEFTKICASTTWLESLMIYSNLTYFFDTDTHEFLKLYSKIGQKVQEHKKVDEQLWGQNWFMDKLSTWIGHEKGNPKTTAHTIYNRANFKIKLSALANSLMRYTDLTQYPQLQSFNVIYDAYKLKRKLEKFRDALNGTDKQTKQLNQLINTMETTLSIWNLIGLHQYFARTNHEDKSTQKQVAKQRLRDIEWHISELLQVLPEGASLVVPHGYVHKEYALYGLVEFDTNSNRINFINPLKSSANERSFVAYVQPTKRSIVKQALKDGLIAALLQPLICTHASLDDAEDSMNHPQDTYESHGKLKLDHTATYKTQVNHNSAHACWEAWLSVKMDRQMWTAFQLFTNQKAQAKLETLQTKYPSYCEENQAALDALKAAGRQENRRLLQTLSFFNFSRADEDSVRYEQLFNLQN